MSKSNKANSTEPSFEESLGALEALVRRLEAPETPLATVVATFAEGQKLLEVCQKRLNEAELILETAEGKSGTT